MTFLANASSVSTRFGKDHRNTKVLSAANLFLVRGWLIPALDSLTVECGFDNGDLAGKVIIFSNDPL